MAILPREKAPRTVNARLLAALLAFLPAPGCALVRKFNPPPAASTVSLGETPTAVSQGNATAPAVVSREISTSSITLPAGSIVRVTPAAGNPTPLQNANAFAATLSAPAVVTTRTETQTARTATPPAPPSPIETARAETVRDSLRLFVYAGLALALVAGFLAYTGHTLAALKLGAAAVALPALAFWASAHVALIVSAALVAAAATAVSLWYSHVKPAQNAAQPAKAP